MLIKLDLVRILPILLPLFALAAIASPARAAPEDGPIITALFHITDGEGFTPPAQNAALQALLAKHPALSFTEACGVGDAAEMARQLKRDPKLATAWTRFGWTPLHLAAFSGVPAAVQLLLDRSVDVQARSRNKFKNTPLQAALLAGQLATVKQLLAAGADPLVRQSHGFTPLQEASLLGRRDLVDALLTAGAELNSRADDGRTALTEALRGKHTELADYLRSRGAHGSDITADLAGPPKD
jgi:hypothetical protein